MGFLVGIRVTSIHAHKIESGKRRSQYGIRNKALKYSVSLATLSFIHLVESQSYLLHTEQYNHI